MRTESTSRIFVLVLAIAVAAAAPAFAHNLGEMGDMEIQEDQNATQMSPGDVDAMSHGGMDMGHDIHMMHSKNMMLHMKWTPERTPTGADEQRAAKLVDILKTTLAKYQDYKVAEADGYKPFHPEFKNQKVIHFTRWWYGMKAAFTFNPAEPTSLLYERTGDGGYKLIGAMYTASRHASLDKLNERVPLSVARWHEHIDLCFPPKGTAMASADWTKFGPNGSIATRQACDEAGGRFYPLLFGWMVHVYPWETNPKQVWAH
jgi:hypothetical protein